MDIIDIYLSYYV